MTEKLERAFGDPMIVEREDQTPSSLAGLWLVVHTKPKAEEQARVELQKQGYRVYLPRLAIFRSKQRRAIGRNEPLFPRYLFVYAGTPDAPLSSDRLVTRKV